MEGLIKATAELRYDKCVWSKQLTTNRHACVLTFVLVLDRLSTWRGCSNDQFVAYALIALVAWKISVYRKIQKVGYEWVIVCCE